MTAWVLGKFLDAFMKLAVKKPQILPFLAAFLP